MKAGWTAIASAAALSAALAGCGGSVNIGVGAAPQALAGGLTQAQALAQFDNLWSTFDQQYAYFDYKGIDWPALREEFRPKAAQAGTQDALNAVLVAMLGRLRDTHVHLDSSSGASLATYTPAAFVNWDKTVWQAYAARIGWVQLKPDLGYALVPGGAYVAVGSFNTAHYAAQDVDALLERVKDSPALVLDLRANGGGDDGLAGALASRMTSGERIGDYVQFRNGPGHGDFTPLQARSIGPRGAWQYTRPVLLLVGRRTSSSAESFTSFMRTLPNVTVIGDTTAGASGNPQVYQLSGGWTYSVSHWIAYTADRQPIEGRGIAPAVPVAATAADFARGVDPVLDLALAALASGRGI